MIIGTRGSELAMVQTNMVLAMLKEKHPELDVEVRTVTTTGDIVRDRPLGALGGYGALTKELDRLIVNGEIDAAVNSLKDMPVDLTEGRRWRRSFLEPRSRTSSYPPSRSIGSSPERWSERQA